MGALGHLGAQLGFDTLCDAVEVIGECMVALLAGSVDVPKEAEEAKAAKVEAASKRAIIGVCCCF